MNLRKQVEPLKKAALQASSLQRHAHHAASRLTWVKRWLKRAYRHHVQSRELKPWSPILSVLCSGFKRRLRTAARFRGASVLDHEEAIDDSFELAGALRQLTAAGARGVTAAKQLVGDVQRGEHGQAQRVAGRGLVGGGAHLLVDVARQPGDVVLIERAPDRIALSVDLDRDDRTLGLHYRLSASSWSSMSATRVRITSRSSLSVDTSVAI